jgi:hypothetical protein
MIDKSKMIDSTGRYLTQGLFYEVEYDHTFAQYTLASNDKEVGGRTYPSIKRLYLELEDITEYEFANTYFVDFPHWQKICNNSYLRKEIDKWRNELELKLRARALKNLVGQAEKGNFNAAKYIAGKEWESKRGRPSKEEKAGVLKKEAELRDELAGEASRVLDFIKAKEKKHA